MERITTLRVCYKRAARKKEWNMNGKLVRILLLVALASLLAGQALAADDYIYTGLKKCKMCHKSAKIGGQFGVWEKGPHAQAFADLTSEAGLAKAKELGVENPAEADACLKCHSTGHAAKAEAKVKVLAASGVSCEACHGPGSAYMKKKTMVAITAGTLDGATVGLITQTEAVCLNCHCADNPGHKGEFDFEKFVKQIAHPLAEKG
jgi:hypothetical protein